MYPLRKYLPDPVGYSPAGEKAGHLPSGSRSWFLAAVEYYAGQSIPTSNRFDAEIRRLVASIETMPRRYGPWRHGTRRARTRYFRYLVIFAELPTTLLIVAVAHTRQRPDYWLQRLD